MPERSYTCIAALCLLSSMPGCHRVEGNRADHPRIAAGVSMRDITFHSAALNRDMPYRVFLPTQINPGRQLPVIYLLHGGDDGSYLDWSNESDVSRYAAEGLILVMPEGEFSYYMNAAEKPNERYEDYTFVDLISDVETRFPAARDRDERAIVGISMGGYAAIKLALPRPRLFTFVGAFSPSVDIVHRTFKIRRISEWWRIQTIFGPRDSETRRSRDPFALVKKADPAQTPYIYLTSGETDHLLEPDRQFADELSKFHFHYEFHIKPGGHDWTQWDAQIPGCFDSLFRHVKTASLIQH